MRNWEWELEEFVAHPDDLLFGSLRSQGKDGANAFGFRRLKESGGGHNHTPRVMSEVFG